MSSTLNLNDILQGNVLSRLKELPNECVDCVITSPPYYALRSYSTNPQIWGGDPDCEHDWVDHVRKPAGGRGSKNANVGANKNDVANLRDGETITNFCSKCGAWKGELGLEPDFKEYVNHLCDIFDEVQRVLKPTGTLWVNIGDTYNGTGDKGNYKDPKNPNKRNGQGKAVNNIKTYPRKSLLQIPSRFAIEMVDRGWILRQEIIWQKDNCMPSPISDRPTTSHEKLFFFTKNTKYSYNQVKEPSVEDPTKLRNIRSVWNINTHPLKGSHVATFPVALAQIPIEAGCPENGVVMDIFMGSGTVAVTTLYLNKRDNADRKFLGIELNQEYIDIAKNRIHKYESEGKLY